MMNIAAADTKTSSKGTIAIPGVPALRNEFAGAEEAVQFALEQELRVTDEINNLVTLSLGSEDHVTNNFLQWFVTEQVEEVDTMTTLLQTIRHSAGNLLWVEEFVRRNPQDAGIDGAEA